MSDIAWARTERLALAARIALAGDRRRQHDARARHARAQAHLLAGWLRSRLGHGVEVEVEEHPTLEGIDLDGKPAPFPPGRPPNASDVLSAELDRFTRDRVYEGAVLAAA